MSSHGPCGEVRLELAVYVLGAQEPADRGVVGRHLADCAGCRDELAGLAGLPALLRRVSVQEASALAAYLTVALARSPAGTSGTPPRSGPAHQLRPGRHRPVPPTREPASARP